MNRATVSTALARFIKISPYKLRPLVDGVRGKSLPQAFNWLYSQPAAKTVPVFKVLQSAWHNAKNLNPKLEEQGDVLISIATVDQGPTFKYAKPGSMGRSVIQRRRQSHIKICLAKKEG